MIVDEYGTTEGIVTATDILESIAGDLPERGEPAGGDGRAPADGSLLIDGMMPIDEFEDRVGVTDCAAGGDFETVAGFVDQPTRAPARGRRPDRPPTA